ncbi:MAG TPA: hypothetical protein VLG76_04590 [Rhabdochlamydiaceae bacterium]|nr:hypothetical protein [Rhabdochlamydiaceae bacterium]
METQALPEPNPYHFAMKETTDVRKIIEEAEMQVDSGAQKKEIESIIVDTGNEKDGTVPAEVKVFIRKPSPTPLPPKPHIVSTTPSSPEKAAEVTQVQQQRQTQVQSGPVKTLSERDVVVKPIKVEVSTTLSSPEIAAEATQVQQQRQTQVQSGPAKTLSERKVTVKFTKDDDVKKTSSFPVTTGGVSRLQQQRQSQTPSSPSKIPSHREEVRQARFEYIDAPNGDYVKVYKTAGLEGPFVMVNGKRWGAIIGYDYTAYGFKLMESPWDTDYYVDPKNEADIKKVKAICVIQ